MDLKETGRTFIILQMAVVLVNCGVNIHLQLLHFATEPHSCCDIHLGWFTTYCSDCDMYFIVAIKDAYSNRTLLSKTTSQTEDAFSVDFSESVHPNQLNTELTIWKGSLTVDIKAVDHDDTSFHDDIDHLVYTYEGNTTISEEITLTTDKSNLTVSLTIECQENYYGEDCSLYCANTTNGLHCTTPTLEGVITPASSAKPPSDSGNHNIDEGSTKTNTKSMPSTKSLSSTVGPATHIGEDGSPKVIASTSSAKPPSSSNSLPQHVTTSLKSQPTSPVSAHVQSESNSSSSKVEVTENPKSYVPLIVGVICSCLVIVLVVGIVLKVRRRIASQWLKIDFHRSRRAENGELELEFTLPEHSSRRHSKDALIVS